MLIVEILAPSLALSCQHLFAPVWALRATQTAVCTSDMAISLLNI